MADHSATFALDLESNSAGVAQASAAALEQLRDKIQGDIAALRDMQRALNNLRGGGATSAATMAQLKDRIAAQKATIAGAQAQYISLGGAFGKAAKPAAEAGNRLDRLREAALTAGGPVGGLVSRLGKLSTLVGGGVIAGGLLAIAAALAALTAAAVAAGSALVAYAVKQADAYRSERLRLEGLTKIRYWMFGIAGATSRAADSASFLQSTIDGVTSKVALGRSQIVDYTNQLYRMGLRGANLQQALEGMAITAATQGDAQAQAFAHWAASVAFTGGQVRKLTDDVRARLGPIARAQLLSLDVQAQKLRENFGALFQDLKIERLLEGIASVTALFSQSTYTGRALKALVDTLLQPLINSAASGAPILKRFFQGITIAALIMGIAILRVRNWLRDTFGGSDLLKKLDLQRVAVYAGVAAFSLLAGAAATVVAVMGAVAAAIATAAAPFVFLATLAVSVYQAFVNTPWRKLGTAVVEGIGSGIRSGAKWVVSAITGLADATIKAFKDKFEIRSPSRRMFREASQVSAGIEAAYEHGRSGVERAAEALAAPPPVTATANASNTITPRASGVSSISVTIERIEVGSRDDLQGLEARIREAVTRAIESVAVTIGAPA